MLHVAAPGETVPRSACCRRANIPSPILAALVTRQGTYAADGLAVVRAQSAVPALEQKLANIAASDADLGKALLEGIGRHVKTTDAEALHGLAYFLETGGTPATLLVMLGKGTNTTTAETVAALRQLTGLSTKEIRAIDAVIGVHGTNARGTDTIVGIAARYAAPGAVFTGIAEIADYAEGGAAAVESGFGTLLTQLSSEDAGKRQQAWNAMQEAREMVARDTPRLRFELPRTSGPQVLTVRDDEPVDEPRVEVVPPVAARRPRGCHAERRRDAPAW